MIPRHISPARAAMYFVGFVLLAILCALREGVVFARRLLRARCAARRERRAIRQRMKLALLSAAREREGSDASRAPQTMTIEETLEYPAGR